MPEQPLGGRPDRSKTLLARSVQYDLATTGHKGDERILSFGVLG